MNNNNNKNNRIFTTRLMDKVLNLIIDGNEEDIRDTDQSQTHLTRYDDYYLNEIKNIRSILPWFIIVFGLIGNFWILLIFMKKSRRQTSSGFCFIALALSDSVALIFMLLRSLLRLQILGNVSLACKLIRFIYYSSLQISSWCLVLLTLDRLIAVLFLFRYNWWSKKLHVLKLLIVIICTILLINLHSLIFVSSKMREQDETIYPRKIGRFPSSTSFSYFRPNKLPRYACYCDQYKYPFYYKYIYSKWDVFHSIIYGGLPFLIIFSSNIAIVSKLTFLKNKKQFRKVNADDNSESSSIKSKQITIMLLSIAFIYLILTSPVSFYMAFLYDNLTHIRESKREYIKVVLRYLAYFNNAINFYIYLAFSSGFRKEFKKTINELFNLKNGSVNLCSTDTTESTSSNDNLNRPKDNRMLYVKQKPNRPIYTKNNDDNLNQPFLSRDDQIRQSNNAVEKYKLDNRNAKLFYYKSDSKYRQNDLDKFAKSSTNKNENDNNLNNERNDFNVDNGKPFISPYATIV